MNQARHLNRVAALAALAILGAVPAIAGPGGKVVTATQPACEECLSYDFFDLQYIYTSFDHLEDGNGVGANLSKDLGGNVYLTLSGAWTGTGLDGEDGDIYGGSAGLGYYIPVATRLHLNIEGGALYGGSDGLGEDDEDAWGWYVGPGFRYCLSPGMEVFANAYYTRFEDGFDQWEANVGIIADITDTVAFKLAGLLNDDDQSILVGIRLYY